MNRIARAAGLMAALATSAAVTPAAAIDRIAPNLQNVTSTGPGTFTVSFRAGRGAPDYWCAAGEFVVKELNLSRTTRIWRTAPEPPRPQGASVSFSLSPEGAVHSGLAVISTSSRGGLTASHARQLCRR